MRALAAGLVALVLAFAPVPSLAQGQLPGVLVLDQERFFSGSMFGQRIQAEIDAIGQEIASENRSIETALTAEELELTERRAELSREEFSVLADEFDTRVERIRAEQEAKARALTEARDRARQQYFELALPILLELTSERGGAVILDRRSVLLAADQIDITDAAIAAVDERLGTGPEEPLIVLEITDAPIEEDAAEPETGTIPETDVDGASETSQ